MRNITRIVVLPLLLALCLFHAASASACRANTRWPGGPSTVQYLADLNPNLGDWGTIFLDADDNACASQALAYFQAKMNAQNAVGGRWTGWLKGGDVFLMSSAALRFGARGLLSSNLHGQIVTALTEYYDSTVGVGCSISAGNGCMDEYTVAAAGYSWAGAYLWLTQSMAGSHNAGDFLVKGQDYVARSLSPLYSVCIHHIHPRPLAAADSCVQCTTDYNPGGPYDNNASDLRSRISNGDTEVLTYEHNFENPDYGIGLLTSVGTAVLGLRRAGATYSPSEIEKVIAHGLLRNGQLHAKPYASSCDLAWTHDYCVGSTCSATNTTCITNVCAVPTGQPCYDQFGSYEYNPGMFPIKGLLSREYASADAATLDLGSPYYQFDQWNGFCSGTPFQTYTPGEYNDFFNDARWAAYYTLPVVWSESSAGTDPQPRLAGVDPVQHVDSPTPFTSQPVRSGPNSLFGWAFDGLGSISSSSFSFKVDGGPVTLQGFSYGGSRTDVCAFFGLTNQPASCPLGWGGTYTPPMGFTTGWHTFEVTIVSSSGSVSRFTRGFYFTP